MTQTFRILHKSIETKTESAETIVKVTCILHNVIIDNEGTDLLLTDKFQSATNMPSLGRNSVNG